MSLPGRAMELTRRFAVWCSSALGFLLIILWLSQDVVDNDAQLRIHTKPEQVRFVAPKHNVWADLNTEEASEIYEFLIGQWPELDLTVFPRGPNQSFINIVEVLQPNKTDVLPYLYSNGSRPERWAKTMLANNTGVPRLEYYAVGPLPVSSGTRIIPLTYPFNSGRHYVNNIMVDMNGSLEFGLSLAEGISDITTELLGARVNRDNPYDPDSLQAHPRFRKFDSGGVILWYQLFRSGMQSSSRTILPQGIYAKVNATSLDVHQWTIDAWWYNGRLFSSADQFREGLKSHDFSRTPPNLDGTWTETEDFDASPDGRELPPPLSIQPYGPRYKLDRIENYVQWFGFSFYLASTQATGVSLFDVRFRGERVLYELSLQEALAHYAGDDPMAGGQEFLDTFFGMGSNSFELVRGYDCPAYADYLDTELHRGGETETRHNNICLFEFTSDHLLSRHTAQFSVTVSRNTYLIVRSVSTVGNYDYTIDYIFYMDGAMEVKVRASGFIYGAFYTNNTDKTEDEYGHRVHTALSSSIHDHVINFKADLDICGPANDMVRLVLEPTTAAYDWDLPEIKERHTMHLKEYQIDQEEGLDWPGNSAESYIVYSANKKNSWGERRGYRIVSGTGVGNTPHLTIINSTALGKSAKWAEKDIWVLRRKDEEPRAADPLNYLEAQDPLVDFEKLVNHESLRHEEESSHYDGDLVLYFNVGSHHIPHSGDIPNTLMHTSATAILLTPHNFADRDPSRESVQGVRLQMKGQDSGNFAGWDPARGTLDDEIKTLESRESKYRIHEGANYFGRRYDEDLQLPSDSLDPDLEVVHGNQFAVTDLGLNGSAAGIWFR